MRSYSAQTIKARIKSLKARHIATSESIRNERNRANPNQFTIQDLKRRRLKLKDEIAGYCFI